MTSHRRHAVLLLLSALAAAGQTTAVLSDEPRIFLQPGFLTEEECEKLISLAASRLEVPLLRAADSDFELIEPSSETAVHQRAILEPDWELELPWLQSIVKRMHVFARVPIQHGEPLHVGRYRDDEQFPLHRDSFGSPWAPGYVDTHGGRHATMMVYLRNVSSGGHTVFPFVPAGAEVSQLEEPPTSKADWVPPLAPFCEDEALLRVKPVAGTALLFYNHDVDGYFNPLSMHGGCPPGSGEEKWIAQRWFYQRPSRVGRGVYGDVYRSPYAHRSADLDPRCKMWAADGECLNNGDFMSSECAQSCREHADADLAQSSVKDEL